MSVSKEIFGSIINPFTRTQDIVERYTIKNERNMSVQVLTYGATISSIKVPNKTCTLVDVCLGYDDMKGYQSCTNPYIGGTIGRVCNYITNGKFILDDREYKLKLNYLDEHTLNGGFIGFDKVLWTESEVRPDGISLEYTSPDGHEGFPGTIKTTAHFTLTNDNILHLHYEAETNKSCPINLCNHAYFNLAGHDAGQKALYEHDVLIKARKILVKDMDNMPTGELKNVKDTPYDCCEWKNIGESIQNMEGAIGFNDTYCVEYDKDKEKLSLVARAWHCGSGILLDIWTNQQVVHFYTANDMPDVSNGVKPNIFGKFGANYEKHGSFSMQACGYPNAVNIESFPRIILKPDETYSYKCDFSFSALKESPEIQLQLQQQQTASA